MEATDLALPAVMELAFRDEDSPFIRVRDRAPLPACGLMVFNQYVTGNETDVESEDRSAEVRSCVWDAHQAGAGAEYVIHRDSADAGILTRTLATPPK